MSERGTPTGEPPASASEQGLVSSQQSLKPVTAPVRFPRGRVVLPSEQAARRRRAVRAVRDHVKPKKRRWSVVVTDDKQSLTLDTHMMRLKRCQSRVHAWASALPHDNRRVRRARKNVHIGPRMVMLTLTYADADAWEPLQIRDFMVGLRAEVGPGLLAYAWVLEMQERGAPHYHVLLYVKRGTKIPRPDDRLWEHGMSRIETVRTPYYICKYTSGKKQKAYQKEGFPPGARMFAVKIYASAINDETMLEFRKSAVPAWFQEKIDESAADLSAKLRWKRASGGGWVIVDTGELHQSPWKVVAVLPLDDG